MTSSNANLRKSTRNTTLALILGGVAVAASGYLVFLVNGLDQKYGRIVDDFDHYAGQLSSTRETVQLTRVQLGILNDQRVNLTQQIALADSTLRSAEQQSTDALQRRESAQEDLEKLQDRLSDAKDTISTADRLRPEVAQAENTKNSLKSQIAAMNSDIEELDSDQRDKRAERDRIVDEVARLTPKQEALQVEVNRLSQAKETLTATKASFDRLTTEENRLKDALSELLRKEREARIALSGAKESLDSAEAGIAKSNVEAAALAVSVENFRGEVGNLEVKQQTLKADIAGKRDEVIQFKRRAAFADARFTEVSGSLSAETEKLTAAREELSKLQSQIPTLRAQMESNEDDVTRLKVVQEQVASLTFAVKALAVRKTRLETEVPNLVATAEDAQLKIATVEIEVADQERRNVDLIARIATLEEEEASLARRREALAEGVRGIQSRSEASQIVRDGLQTEEATLRAQVEALVIQNSDLDEQVSRRKESLRVMENAVVSERSQISTLRAQLESNEGDFTRLKVVQEQVASLTLAVKALAARKTRLETEVPNLVATAEDAQLKIATVEIEVADQERRHMDLIARIATLEEEEASLARRREALAEGVRGIQSRSEASQIVRDGLQVEEATLRAQAEALVIQKSDLDEQVSRRKDSLRVIENAVVSEIARLTQLKAEPFQTPEAIIGSGNEQE